MKHQLVVLLASCFAHACEQTKSAVTTADARESSGVDSAALSTCDTYPGTELCTGDCTPEPVAGGCASGCESYGGLVFDPERGCGYFGTVTVHACSPTEIARGEGGHTCYIFGGRPWVAGSTIPFFIFENVGAEKCGNPEADMARDAVATACPEDAPADWP